MSCEFSLIPYNFMGTLSTEENRKKFKEFMNEVAVIKKDEKVRFDAEARLQ